MKLVTRPHRAWYGRLRWRWYWLDRNGDTISYSARSWPYEQQAWEAARFYFEQPVTMVYDHAGEHFELYAGGQEFSD